MKTAHEESRTLVKSSPELWAELSDAASLARHLGEFGEIKITRLEPETVVAWEGERARGTVRLEPSGWGTKVTLTAQTASPPHEPPVPEPDPVPVSEPMPVSDPVPVSEPVPAPKPDPPSRDPDPLPPAAGQPPRHGLWSRVWRALGSAPPPRSSELRVPEPVPAAPEPVPPAPAPLRRARPKPAAPPAPPSLDAAAVLTAALDSLGQAHHRPFSRS